MPLIHVLDDGPLRVVTMTHAERRNALGHAMAEEIAAAIEGAECRVLVLRAEPGVSTWSAGHDINDLPTDGRDPLAWTSPVEHLVRAVRDAPFPVIAAVEGGWCLWNYRLREFRRLRLLLGVLVCQLRLQ